MAAGKKTLGVLIVDLLLKDDQFSRGLKKSVKDVNIGHKQIQASANKVANVTSMAMKAAAASIAAFGAATAVVGAKFEQQMAMVGALKGLEQTDTAFQRLESHARHLGSTTEFTATQAGQALEALSRAGASTADAIEISSHALNLAGTSAASLEGATQILVATQRQFGMGAEDSARITNVLSAAMRNSLLDFESLREGMKYGGIAGAAFGYTLEETTAAMAKFKDLGLEGSQAGTQFRSAMAFAGAQTEKQAKVLAKYNLTLEDINPETHKFADILETVGRAGMTTTDTMKVFGRIGGSVGLLAQKAAEGTLQMKELTQTLNESSDEGNTVKEMYKAISNTVSYQAKIAYSALQELFITVFDLFKGPLKDLISEIPNVLNTISETVKQNSFVLKFQFQSLFSSMSKFLKENAADMAKNFVTFIRVLVDFGNGIKPIIGLIASLVKWVNELAVIIPAAFAVAIIVKSAAAVQSFASAIGAARVAVTLFGTTLTVSTGGLYALVMAIGVVVAAVSYYVQNVLSATEATRRLSEAQAHLEGKQKQVTEALRKSIETELKSAQVEARRRLANEELTQAQEERLKSIIRLTSEQATQMVQEGKLLRTKNGLFTVQELLNIQGQDTESIVKKEATQRIRKANAIQRERIAMENALSNQLRVNESMDQGALTLQKYSKVIGKSVVTIEDVQAKIAGWIEEENRLRESAFQLRNDLADTTADKAKAARTAALEQLRKEVEENRQASQQIKNDKEAAINAILALEQQAIKENNEAFMESEELEQQRLMDRLDRTEQTYTQLANMYKEGSAERIAIEQAMVATMQSITAVYNKKKSDKDQEDAKKNAERLANIQQRAQDKLVDMRQRSLSESERIEAEKRRVMEELAEASGSTRLAIAREYEQLINEALANEGKPKRYGNAWQKTLSKMGVGFKKFGKVAGKIVKGLVDGVKLLAKGMKSMFGFFSDISGGFSFSPAGITDELLAAKRKAEEEGLNFDTAQTTRKIVDDMVDGAIEFTNTLVEALPVMIQRLTERLPELLQNLTEQLPVLFQAIADNLPGLIQTIIDALPALFEALMFGLLNLVQTLLPQLPGMLLQILTETLPQMIMILAQVIPQLIAEFAAAIPDIIDALVQGIPVLIRSIIRAIPLIISAVIRSIPDIVMAIIMALPQIAFMLVKAIFTELIPAIPKMVGMILVALVEVLVDGLKKIGQAIGDVFRSKKGKERAKERRAQREADKEQEQKDKLMAEFDAEWGDESTSAFSGMSYVPATMRMTLHKGEAVIPADRAARMREGGPAAAGLHQEHNYSSGGSGQPIEISVVAEGRLLEAVQIKAEERGHADRMSKAIRRASGTTIGFQRGKFNAWTS